MRRVVSHFKPSMSTPRRNGPLGRRRRRRRREGRPRAHHSQVRRSTRIIQYHQPGIPHFLLCLYQGRHQPRSWPATTPLQPRPHPAVPPLDADSRSDWYTPHHPILASGYPILRYQGSSSPTERAQGAQGREKTGAGAGAEARQGVGIWQCRRPGCQCAAAICTTGGASFADRRF